MQHPDEGTIHAWLDGELPPAEAGTLESHVAGCATCAAAVAEARGLLAASSRILSALDAVPGGVLPATAPQASGIADFKASRTAAPRSRSAPWRSTPWRAAAAIVLVGSVSWLATHSGVQPAADGAAVSVISDTRTEMSKGYDSSGGATGEGGRVATAEPSIANRAPAPMTAPSGALGKVIISQGQGGVNAAKTAAPSVASARKLEPRVDAFGTGAAAPARETVGAAVGDVSGMLASVAADEARRDAKSADAAGARSKVAATGAIAMEQRASNEPSVVMQSARPPMTPSLTPPAPTMARLMTGAGGDALQPLLGCYSLELSTSTPGLERDEAGVLRLPRRIELLSQRAALADGSTGMLLRPAAGEPGFAEGTTGTWEMSGDAIQLRIGDGKRWVNATLKVEGDSVSGEVSGSAGGKGTVKGKKSGCVR